MKPEMPNPKIVIKPLRINNPFMKTYDEVCSLFGIPTSIRQRIKFLAKESNQGVRITDRSLDNLAKKGLSEKVITNSVLTIIDEYMAQHPEFAVVDKLSCTIQPQSIVIDTWRVLFEGLKAAMVVESFDRASVDSLLQPLMAFIERRWEESLGMREWAKQHHDLDEKEFRLNITSFFSTFINKTRLSEEEVNHTMSGMTKYAQGRENEISTEELYALYLSKQDFTLSLFATLDLIASNIRNFELGADAAAITNDGGFLTEILRQNSPCYFGRFIELLKRNSGKSYQAMATRIPTAFKGGSSGRTKQEAQLERLKEWRKGKARPSDKSFMAFCLQFKPYDYYPLMILGHICLSIDKMWSAANEADRVLIEKMYTPENYLKYWEGEKRRQQQCSRLSHSLR